MGDWFAGEPALVRYCCRAGACDDRQVRTRRPQPGSLLSPLPHRPQFLGEQKTWGAYRRCGPLSPARAWALVGTCLKTQLPGVGAAVKEPESQCHRVALQDYGKMREGSALTW